MSCSRSFVIVTPSCARGAYEKHGGGSPRRQRRGAEWADLAASSSAPRIKPEAICSCLCFYRRLEVTERLAPHPEIDLHTA